ncbi:glycosyltransferase family 4 protein [candidate division TA06 bacterium]|uniref:Glycosyltransferase family 4 protein n=1 Tax=candidate division TA06 bacterium TaxID=2250710 RepID=A0A933MJ23_UNCT6|nr:glycosyltransferase family 4 protein [candidate division TA06 bacterium]
MKDRSAIIFVPYIEAFGGCERLLLDLSRYLNSQGIKHKVICYRHEIDLSNYSEWPIKVADLTQSNNPLRRAGYLKKYLSEQSFDQLGETLLVGLQAARHAGYLGLNNYSVLIIDPPSLLQPVESRWKNILDRFRNIITINYVRRGMARASWTAVMTQYISSEIINLCGVHPLLIRPGVSLGAEHFKIRFHSTSEPFHILSVSRLEKSKRIDWIFKALECLDKNNGNFPNGFSWVFDVAGSGSDETRLKRMAREKGLSDKVVFHGHVSPDGLKKLFSMAHLFVMPARQGYGLPALESLIQGIPVLLHRESGVGEILGETQWAEVVDDDSLVEGLERMVDRVRSGFMKTTPLPYIPSSQDWAKQICRQCRWQ